MGKYSYIISPVAYDEKGKEEDRTFDSVSFTSREKADDFINDMGSRWVMYPNIEIMRVSGDGKSFNRKEATLVVGYDSDGITYKPTKSKRYSTSVSSGSKNRTKKRTQKPAAVGMRGLR